MIVPAQRAGERIDRFIAVEMPTLSRSRIQKLIGEGCVTLNGQPARPSTKVREADRVEVVVPPPRPTDVKPEKIPLDIIYCDDDVIVVNKPAGMVTHPSAGHAGGTLVNALLGLGLKLSGVGGEARPGIVHRLDKETSGLIIAARNDLAHQSLSNQLKDRTLSRIYIAVVKGAPPHDEGRIETNLGRHRVNRKKMAVLDSGGKRAITSYKVTQRLEGASVVEARLGTGRTHQIRAHMLHLNCPVIGDKTYGRKGKNQLINRQALHAWKISFVHPSSGQTASFTAPLPEDMTGLIRRLGGDPLPA